MVKTYSKKLFCLVGCWKCWVKK